MRAIKLATIVLTFTFGIAAALFLDGTEHTCKNDQPTLKQPEPPRLDDTNATKPIAAVPAASPAHEAVFGEGKLKIVPNHRERKSERLRDKIDVTYPQIAGSDNLYIRKLNQHIKNLVTDQYQWPLNPSKTDLKYYREKWPDVFNTVDIDYDIRSANDSLLSIYFEGYSYGIGAAHSVQYSFSLNYDLTLRKELKLHDLFEPRSKYLKFISHYCITELSKKPELLFEDALKPRAENFESWNFTREGIQFNFDECKVFGCASDEQVVVIPFDALSQLLNPRWQEEPKTVLDYYLLLPDKYFEANEEQRVKWMLDPKRGAVVDIKNGYIFAQGDGAQTSIYVCLFKRSSGRPLIAVKWHASDTNQFTYLDFFEYKRGALVEIKDDVFPVKINEEFKYKLPHYGRSIEVRDRHYIKIYTLTWTGRRFVLKRSD